MFHDFLGREQRGQENHHKKENNLNLFSDRCFSYFNKKYFKDLFVLLNQLGKKVQR